MMSVYVEVQTNINTKRMQEAEEQARVLAAANANNTEQMAVSATPPS